MTYLFKNFNVEFLFFISHAIDTVPFFPNQFYFLTAARIGRVAHAIASIKLPIVKDLFFIYIYKLINAR
jgi:hypothetical protein